MGARIDSVHWQLGIESQLARRASVRDLAGLGRSLIVVSVALKDSIFDTLCWSYK